MNDNQISFKPYCAQCGSVRPDGDTSATCGPCAKKGHSYPLVHNNQVRLERIARRQKFYTEHKYTAKEIESIPSMQNLLHVPEHAKDKEL